MHTIKIKSGHSEHPPTRVTLAHTLSISDQNGHFYAFFNLKLQKGHSFCKPTAGLLRGIGFKMSHKKIQGAISPDHHQENLTEIFLLFFTTLVLNLPCMVQVAQFKFVALKWHNWDTCKGRINGIGYHESFLFQTWTQIWCILDMCQSEWHHRNTPNLISSNPDCGWYEKLLLSYRESYKHVRLHVCLRWLGWPPHWKISSYAPGWPN